MESYYSRLPKEKRIELSDLSWLVTIWDCEQSIEAFAKYVFTKDEHADGSESVKPFPTREEKPYLWEFIDTVLAEPILLCEKSRQLMITWSMCLILLWVCKFQQNRLCFVQSKKEEDAANLVYNSEPSIARVSFMEWNLPLPLRSEVTASYAKLRFDTGSLLWGIPEGGDQIRSYTASWIFDDEFAFQPEAEAAYKAARPMLSGGGHFVAVSSARAGAYMVKMLKGRKANAEAGNWQEVSTLA